MVVEILGDKIIGPTTINSEVAINNDQFDLAAEKVSPADLDRCGVQEHSEQIELQQESSKVVIQNSTDIWRDWDQDGGTFLFYPRNELTKYAFCVLASSMISIVAYSQLQPLTGNHTPFFLIGFFLLSFSESLRVLKSNQNNNQSEEGELYEDEADAEVDESEVDIEEEDLESEEDELYEDEADAEVDESEVDIEEEDLESEEGELYEDEADAEVDESEVDIEEEDLESEEDELYEDEADAEVDESEVDIEEEDLESEEDELYEDEADAEVDESEVGPEEDSSFKKHETGDKVLSDNQSFKRSWKVFYRFAQFLGHPL